jgi:hypothetical protein
MRNKKTEPKTEATVPPLLLSVIEALHEAGAFDAAGKCAHWLDRENGDLLAAWIAKDFGLDGVHLWFSARWKDQGLHPDGEPFYCTCEELEDTARKLDGKGLSHVGHVLRDIADELPSECDGIIEQELPDYFKRYGPAAVKQQKTQLLARWLFERARITGQSRNRLVQRYGLEDWFDTTKQDIVCENGRWRYLPMAVNGGADG